MSTGPPSSVTDPSDLICQKTDPTRESTCPMDISDADYSDIDHMVMSRLPAELPPMLAPDGSRGNRYKDCKSRATSDRKWQKQAAEYVSKTRRVGGNVSMQLRRRQVTGEDGTGDTVKHVPLRVAVIVK